MEYIVEGGKFSLSYSELKEKHSEFCQMSDDEFLKDIGAATHLACIICYLKEIPTYVCLSDCGIVHELVHLIHIPKGNTTSLHDIRKMFENCLRLA